MHNKSNTSSSESGKTTNSLENSPLYVPSAFFIMLIGLIVLFGSFLFSGEMLYGSDTVTAGIFHRSFLIDNFKATGDVPQWNPLAYCGMPYVDAIHGDIFYPLSVLKYFLPLYFYLGFNLILHIFLAGVFMYLAARQFKLGKSAALLAASCYMFAPCLISLVGPGHDAKIYTAAFFPLVMLFLDRAFESKPFLNFTILGMVLGVIILSPQPETSYFTLWAVALYVLFRLIVLWRKSGSFANLIRPGLMSAYAVVLALLISAIQFLPSYVYATKYSARVVQEASWDWATSWSMHEEEVMSQLIPEFSGTTFPPLPPFDVKPFSTSYWGQNSFKDSSDSVGVIAIYLSLFCLFFARRRLKYFFAALALFSFIYALGATTPFFSFFYYVIPKVNLIRSPSKIIFIFSFSIALMAGMGLQEIIDRVKLKIRAKRKAMTVFLVAFPAVLFVLALLFSIAGKEMLEIWTTVFHSRGKNMAINAELTKLDFALQNLSAIQTGAWFSFLFTAVASFAVWIYQSGKMGFAIMAGLFLLPVINGARFNSRFVHGVNRESHFEPNKLIRFFENIEGDYRVMTLSRETSKSYLPQFGIEVVQGYHGNQLVRFDELMGGLRLVYRLKPRFLNLCGARYVVIPADATLRSDYFGPFPCKPVAFIGENQIVKNDNAFKRIYLMNKYRVFHDPRQLPYTIVEGDEDLTKIVYLEKLPPVTIPPDSIVNDSAWTISRANDSVVVGVYCTANRLLVMMDNYYDSWHVSIDGQPAELLRAFSTFRAVAVPAGAKEVKFVYESDRYETGKLITTFASVYLIGAFGIYYLSYRRKIRPQTNAPSGQN